MSTQEAEPQCPGCGLTRQELAQLTTPHYAQNYPSRIRHLLATNQSPESQERRDLRVTLAQDNRDLYSMTSRLAELRSEMSQLVKNIKQREKKIEDYKAILHPIRYTPNDVLREIFAFAAKPATTDEIYRPRKSSLDQSTMPWVISRVCSNWRSVALSQQPLWSKVVITDSDLILRSNPITTRPLLLNMQLTRSDPLNVYIHTTGQIPNGHPLIVCLISSFNRWRFVSFRSPLDSLYILSPLSGLPLPVEELVLSPIVPNHLEISPEIPLPVVHQLSLPHLKKLHCKYTSWIPQLSIPHRRIEEYMGYADSNVSHLLGALSNLRRCELHLRTSQIRETRQRLPQPPVSNLQKLFIASQQETSSLSEVFAQLRLPSLQFFSSQNIMDVQMIGQILEHSPLLQALELRSPSMNDIQCLHLLYGQRHKTLLTAVALQCPQAFTSLFIDELASSTLIRSLRTLTLTDHGYTEDQIARLKSARPTLVINR